MSDELGRRLSEVAAAGEQAGLPAGPDAVRGRARRRQQRRRAMSGGAVAALVIGVAVAVATTGGSGGGGGQKVNVGGGSTTVVTPTTTPGLPTPTTFAPVPTTVPPVGRPPTLPADGPLVADHSKLSALAFFNTSLGYALTGDPVRLARTQDGGVSWHVVGGPLVAVSDLLFPRPWVGYAWGLGGLLSTSDGGGTWQAVPVPNTVFDLRALGDQATALVGCPDGTCDESLWSIHTSLPGTKTAASASLAVALNYRGQSGSVDGVLGGAPVEMVSSSFAVTPNALLGYANYHSTIATVPDGFTTVADPCQTGDVETQQLAFGASWLVCAGSPATIQQGKQVYRSADAGRHWNLVASVGYGTETGSITLSGHVNRLVAVSDTRAWLALDRIGILATTDGGRTWHEAFSVPPDSGPVEITAAIGSSEAWAIAGQALWHTTDGVTWTKR